MDVKQIKKFLSLFKKHPYLAEMEVEESGQKIRLRRLETPAPVLERPTPTPLSQPQSEETPPPEATTTRNILKIESPMVGTFYRASSPSAKPFIEIGDIIRKGKVVCIIEAMKLMNEIEAELEGRVIEILPQNGRPVEYGEPLFLLEPL